jgi:hypothetical protein
MDAALTTVRCNFAAPTTLRTARIRRRHSHSSSTLAPSLGRARGGAAARDKRQGTIPRLGAAEERLNDVTGL